MYQSLPYIIKSTSILLILFVYYKLFLRKQTFFRLNRIYLLGTLLIAAIVPFITIEIQVSTFIPEAHHPMRIYMSNLLDEVYVLANYTSEAPSRTAMHFNFVLWGYYLGVGVFVFRYLLSLLQIQRFKHCYPGKRFRGICFYFLPGDQPAFSYFNNLFICRDLPREDRRKIFEHEKIHIRQLHSLDLLIAEIICIFNWFNPLVWILKHAMMENHEYIADRQVIRRYHTGSYLELLVRQTFKGAFSFTNYFSCSNLKKRTIMMTKKQSRKYWVLSFIPVTALLVTLLYGFTCSKSAIMPFPFVVPEIPEINSENQAEPIFTSPTVSDDSVLFVAVEEMPRFPGDVSQWISKNVKYPAEAIAKKIEGKVYVQFVVEKDGSVNNIKVVKAVDPLLDKEAVRVIGSMPKWQPGKQKGEVVRVSYTLPIYFLMTSGMDSTPEKKYESYLQKMNECIKKLEDPSLLTEKDLEPIGKSLLGEETDDKAAYRQQIEWIKYVEMTFSQEAKPLMDKFNFSAEEKSAVTKIHETRLHEQLKLIQSIGPDQFIQKFSQIPGFEYTKANVKAQRDLQNSLSPEHYKQLVTNINLKPIEQRDVFVRVEDMPSFQDGDINKWIQKNIKYPAEAVAKKLEGKVYVQFVIEQDGSISGAKVVRGIDPVLDQEALRLVNSMPKWRPGRQRGMEVRVAYTIPIWFRLNK